MISTIPRFCYHFSRACGAIGLLGIFALTAGNVVMRTSFDTQFTSSPTQYVGYLMVFFVYCGAFSSFYEGGFVRADFPYRKLPPIYRYWLGVFFRVILIVYSGYLFYGAALRTSAFIRSGALAPGLANIKMYVPWSSMAVGLGILAIGCTCELAVFLADKTRALRDPD
ncbi:MAG: TRAP transporter small permease [Burkholderiaceae bacterium]|nr:MAG: TRAP transporter small permease [Burkholderiaceae bacterium]